MNNQLPLVTVVIASYNHLSFIDQAVSSVRKQTYPAERIELIIMDDCSSDGSQEWIRSNASKYNYNFVLRSANKGLAHNLNAALMMSNGEYFCVLASDDYWAPEKLEKQIEFMQNHPELAGCSSNALRVNKDGVVFDPKHQRISDPGQWGFEDVMQRKHRLPTVNLLLKTETLKKSGGYNSKYKAEDHYIILKLSSQGGKFALLKDVHGYYRIHGNNTFSKTNIMYKDLLAQLQEYKDHRLFNTGIKSLRRVYFDLLSRENKLLALSLIPKIDWNNKLFFRGIIHLATPKPIIRYRNKLLLK